MQIDKSKFIKPNNVILEEYWNDKQTVPDKYMISTYTTTSID